MTITVTQKVVLAENIIVENLEQDSVLLNLDTLTYISQDDVGTHMFNVLTTSESIDSAFKTLLEDYQIEPELLKKDLFDYIEQLIEQGLVKIEDVEPIS